MVYASQTYSCVYDFLTANSYIIPMVSLVLCYLLVCEIPMFSFKFKSLKWADNKARFSFLGIVAVLALAVAILGLNWSLIVLAVFVTYILVNIIGNICSK